MTIYRQALLKKYFADNQPSVRPRPKLQHQSTLDTDEIKKLSPLQTTDFFNQSRLHAPTLDSQNIESLRFFEEENKKTRLMRITPGRSVDPPLESAKSQKTCSPSIDNLLKGIAKRAKKTKKLEVKLVDVKGGPKQDIDSSQTAQHQNSFSLSYDPITVSQSNLSPLKTKNDESFFIIRKGRKSSSNVSWFAQNSPLKTENHPEKDLELSEKISQDQPSERQYCRSANSSLPRIKHLDLDSADLAQKDEIITNSNKAMLLSLQQSLIRVDNSNKRTSIVSRISVTTDSIEVEKPTSISQLLNSTGSKGKHGRQRSQILIAADLRKSIFAKTPKKEDTPKQTKGNLIFSSRLIPSLDPRK